MEPTAGRAPLAALNQAAALLPPPHTAAKPPPGPLSFTQFHTGWMDKQEAAFKAWLNAVLQPAATAEEAERSQGGLASRRLVARMRGLLWQLYSQDQELVRCGCSVHARMLARAVAVSVGPVNPGLAGHQPHCLSVTASACLQRHAQGGAAH